LALRDIIDNFKYDTFSKKQKISLKAWVCGISFAGIVGSDPVRSMDVCLL
jgi:hypothetical protein